MSVIAVWNRDDHIWFCVKLAKEVQVAVKGFYQKKL